MITKLPFLTLIALVLITIAAKADDYAWGSTTGSSIVKIDATTGLLQPLTYGGKSYTNFPLLDPNSHVNLGASLWVAENSNGTLYGLDNNGNLYTINTTLGVDQNGTPGMFATKIGDVGVDGVTGAVWISSNLLDISATTSLYQYNLTTDRLGAPISVSNGANISGLAYNGTLYAVQYSPSPGMLDSVAGANFTNLLPSAFNGANQQSCTFAGASLLYVSDGNSGFYSYNTGTKTLTPLVNSFGGGLHALTPLSVAGGGGTPTPSPTVTPTATPTPTPTATPKIVYSIPVTGSLHVIAPETTPALNPECAPGYVYTATPTASFAGGAIIDPAGSLGVYRYYQTTTDGIHYLPATALAATPASTVWPWISGTSSNHTAISYTAGVVGVPNNFSYGRETLQLVYTSPGNGTNTVLDTKTIYQYPWNYNSSQTVTPSALFSNAVTSTQAAGNPSPYASATPSPLVFQGDAPRFTVAMNNLYPAGTTSVIIYPGTAASPTGAGTVIPITTTATPNSGLWTNAPAITFEVAPYINTSSNAAQTYTIEAVQTLPSGYPLATTGPNLNPAILQTLTFTTTSGFNVNGTVGTVK